MWKYRDDYLIHHGIKGQKWGIRRYQNEDGSLTEEGKKRYLSDYKSTKTTYYENTYGNNSREAKASRDLDKKISDYYDSQSRGKTIVKNLLTTTSTLHTYNMARATGRSRLNSILISSFDINLGQIAEGVAGGAITGSVNSRTQNSKARLGGVVAGRLASNVVGAKIRDTGKELSLQQRRMRNKYIRENS